VNEQELSVRFGQLINMRNCLHPNKNRRPFAVIFDIVEVEKNAVSQDQKDPLSRRDVESLSLQKNLDGLTILNVLENSL
jgi:hypothetical protein